ncbi:MAG: glycosyltransferase family 4 protein [Gemmatimonadaceae bacterium]|nr:glycosyltransferase family 4 protein [Gemmatimonadaceae bacterium]
MRARRGWWGWRRSASLRHGEPGRAGAPLSGTVAGGRPRLLLVVNHAAFLVSHRLPLLLRAREAGYDVEAAAADDAVSRDATAVAVLRDHGIVYHRLPLSRAGRDPRAEWRAYRALRTLYATRRPALAHHVTIKPVIYGTTAARRGRVPAVVNAVAGLGAVFLDQSAAGRLQRRLVLAAYRRSVRHPRLAMLFQNDADASAFRALRLGAAAEHAIIRGSGVDLAAFAPSPEPTGTPLVVLPARLLRDKGVTEFVGAAAILRARGVAARFALVGEPDANPSAIPRELLAQWVQAGTVEHWGHRDDMPAVLAASSIVCLPSYREGLPKALLEAAASARAVVTTDVPGCRDAVSGESALLVPPRAIEPLVDALAMLLASPARRASMGEAGRALAEARFGVEAIASQTLALYERLLGRAPRTH